MLVTINLPDHSLYRQGQKETYWDPCHHFQLLWSAPIRPAPCSWGVAPGLLLLVHNQGAIGQVCISWIKDYTLFGQVFMDLLQEEGKGYHCRQLGPTHFVSCHGNLWKWKTRLVRKLLHNHAADGVLIFIGLFDLGACPMDKDSVRSHLQVLTDSDCEQILMATYQAVN